MSSLPGVAKMCLKAQLRRKSIKVLILFEEDFMFKSGGVFLLPDRSWAATLRTAKMRRRIEPAMA